MDLGLSLGAIHHAVVEGPGGFSPLLRVVRSTSGGARTGSARNWGGGFTRDGAREHSGVCWKVIGSLGALGVFWALCSSGRGKTTSAKGARVQAPSRGHERASGDMGGQQYLWGSGGLPPAGVWGRSPHYEVGEAGPV